jgi:hypothetical protein
MKTRIAEIIHYTLAHIDELWDDFKTNKGISEGLAAQITSIPIEHKVKCGDCGGEEEVQYDCSCCESGSCAPIEPCDTCNGDGEVTTTKTIAELIERFQNEGM